jgi:hypothetical protein
MAKSKTYKAYIGMDKSRYNSIMKSGKINKTMGDLGMAVYVAPDKQFAESYGDIVLPVLISMKNTYFLDFQNIAMFETDKEYNDIKIDNLKKKGYDSMEITNTVGGRKYPINGGTELLIFDEKNVKIDR